LLPTASVWIFSGTLAPDGPKDFYARWVPYAREIGARVIIDVSGEPLRLAMAQAGAILKMNRDEFSATLGQDLSNDSVLVAAMLQHTPPGGALVVTLGSAGAMASDGRSCWKASSPKVATVSAVGSGDSFAAGLGIGLHQNQSLPEALKLAIACGAANAMTAQAGFLDKNAVIELQGNVTSAAC